VADISMCSGNKCPIRESCLRHKAVPSRWQSFIAAAYNPSSKECENFAPLTPSDTLLQKANGKDQGRTDSPRNTQG